MMPQDFKPKKYYLSTRTAMKIQDHDYFTTNWLGRIKSRLAKLVEKDSHRSFTDCTDFVGTFTREELDTLRDKSMKFVR